MVLGIRLVLRVKVPTPLPGGTVVNHSLDVFLYAVWISEDVEGQTDSTGRPYRRQCCAGPNAAPL